MPEFPTYRRDVESVFQSLVADVLRRQSRAAGEAETPSPDASHPLISAAAELAGRHLQTGEIPDQPSDALVNRFGSAALDAWHCVSLAARLCLARQQGDQAEIKRLEDEFRFSTCDPCWIQAIAEYEAYFGLTGTERRIPYIRHQHMDDFVLETLPPDARIAVVGDWGTGTPEARALLEQIAGHEPDAVIHLGDIYYSGTESETEANFLEPINRILRRDSRAVPVYTLSGNHDMYSGGRGYYSLLPKLNPAPAYRPEQAQPASYFALRTTDHCWQFLCMDTGLHDHDPFDVLGVITYLDPAEAAWHLDKVRRFPGRTILFSHHQLFSAYEAIGRPEERTDFRMGNPKLLADFEQFRSAGDIAAWFWGHEHNLEVYRPYTGLPLGVCLGHGAIPVSIDSKPYEPLAGIPDLPQLVADPHHPQQKLELAQYGADYAHGFVMLALSSAEGSLTATFYQDSAPGEPMYTTELPITMQDGNGP